MACTDSRTDTINTRIATPNGLQPAGVLRFLYRYVTVLLEVSMYIRINATYSALILLMSSLAVIQVSSCPTPIIPYFFGDKTISMFDIWVFGHLLFGIILAGTGDRLGIKDSSTLICSVISAMCFWEVAEFLMELGYFGHAIAYWKAGVEHWTNRYIADIGIGLIGLTLYRSWPHIYWPALILGGFWEAINVLSPTAMSLQEWLLNAFAA